jgi:AsmA family protein
MKRTIRVLFAIIVVCVGLGAAGLAILNSLDFNQYRDLIAERIEGITGRKLTIEGDLSLDVSLNPSLRLEAVSLANADWGSQPEMLRISRLDAAVDLIPLLSGEARISHIRVSGFDLFVETDAGGRGNWLFDTGDVSKIHSRESSESAKSPFVPVFEEIVLEDLNVAFLNGKNGNSYRTNIKALTARQAKRGLPIDLAGNGTIGSSPYEITGIVGPIAALVEGKDYPINLKLSAFDSEVGIDGILANGVVDRGLVFGLWMKSPDIGKTAELASAAIQDLKGIKAPNVPFAASVSLARTEDRFELINFKANLGDSNISGKGVVNLAEDRPRLNAEFASKRLDFARLFPAASAEQPGKQQTKPGADISEKPARIFPADPLPLDGLRAIDAKLSLSVDSIRLANGIGIEKAMVKADLERGRLVLAPIQAQVGGGRIDGRIELDGLTGTASMSVSVSGKKVRIGDLLGQLELGGVIEGGATDLKLEMKGKGASVRDIMAGLNGEITVEVGEGRIHNSALDIAGADVFMQMFGALSPGTAQQDFSALSCAVVKFDIKDGLARAVKGIALETDKVNMVGEGVIDLKTEKIDFAVNPEAREGAGLNLGGAAAGLVRVRGTLAEPAIGIDEVGAAKTAASVGAALATGGLSLLGEALVSRTTRDSHPCLTALGKTPPDETPAKTKPAPEPASKIDNIGEDAKGLFKGVGDAFGKLLGGKK